MASDWTWEAGQYPSEDRQGDFEGPQRVTLSPAPRMLCLLGLLLCLPVVSLCWDSSSIALSS